MGVMFWAAGSGIHEHGGVEHERLQGDRRVRWGGARKHLQSLPGEAAWDSIGGAHTADRCGPGRRRERGDAAGPMDGISVVVRNGDVWKRADLAGALAESL